MNRNLTAATALLALAAFGQNTREGRLDRGGFQLWYRVQGAGVPVVILSGGPGLDCDYMVPVAAEIGKRRRAILPELRGTGRSLPPKINRDTVSLPAYVSDLDALRASLGFPRWTLLGHSAGAGFAMAYAAAHPGRVDSLVLVSSAPIASSMGADMADNINRRLTAEEKKRAAEAMAKGDFAAVMRIWGPAYFYDPEKAAAFMNVFRPESFHQDVMLSLNRDYMGPGVDFRPKLKEFARPVLIVAGRQDPLDPAVQYEIHLALKNSQLKLIPRCGHFPWIEQPDEFYRTVWGFLDGHMPAAKKD